jgi:hypothetical protein
MNEQMKRRARFLLVFGAYFVGLWLLWGTPVVYPLKLFVVLLHEISHGLAALATGGRIDAIEINPREGGFCRCGGGSAFLTLSAGYLGSLFWGGLMIWGARRLGSRSDWLTAGIGLVAAGTSFLFVRQPFALAFGLAFGGALVAAGVRLGAGANRALLTGLGLTSCLYAVLDIKSDILDRPNMMSDARMLAELTGIPTVVWGTAWIAIAIAFCVVLFRWAWSRA